MFSMNGQAQFLAFTFYSGNTECIEGLFRLQTKCRKSTVPICRSSIESNSWAVASVMSSDQKEFKKV